MQNLSFSYYSNPKYASFLKRYIKVISFGIVIFSILFLSLFIIKIDLIFILLLLIIPILSFSQAFYRLKYYLLSVEIVKNHLLITYMKYNRRISLDDKIENFTIKKKHAKYNNHRDFYLIITHPPKQIKLRQFQTLDWNENVMNEFINAFEDKSIHVD